MNSAGLLEVDVSGRGWAELPGALWTLSRAEALRAGDNRLRALPSGLGALRKLRVLHAPRNRLVLLPDTIANCAHLTEVGTVQRSVQFLPKRVFTQAGQQRCLDAGVKILTLGHQI